MEIRYPGANPKDGDTISKGEDFVNHVCKKEGWIKSEKLEDQIGHGDAYDPKTGEWGEIKRVPGIKYEFLTFEVAERARGEWFLSGIFSASDATWYVQGNERGYLKLRRSDLIELAKAYGITPEVVVKHFQGTEINLRLDNYNGTMLRLSILREDVEEIAVPVGMDVELEEGDLR